MAFYWQLLSGQAVHAYIWSNQQHHPYHLWTPIFKLQHFKNIFAYIFVICIYSKVSRIQFIRNSLVATDRRFDTRYYWLQVSRPLKGHSVPRLLKGTYNFNRPDICIWLPERAIPGCRAAVFCLKSWMNLCQHVFHLLCVILFMNLFLVIPAKYPTLGPDSFAQMRALSWSFTFTHHKNLVSN